MSTVRLRARSAPRPPCDAHAPVGSPCRPRTGTLAAGSDRTGHPGREPAQPERRPYRRAGRSSRKPSRPTAPSGRSRSSVHTNVEPPGRSRTSKAAVPPDQLAEVPDVRAVRRVQPVISIVSTTASGPTPVAARITPPTPRPPLTVPRTEVPSIHSCCRSQSVAAAQVRSTGAATSTSSRSWAGPAEVSGRRSSSDSGGAVVRMSRAGRLGRAPVSRVPSGTARGRRPVRSASSPSRSPFRSQSSSGNPSGRGSAARRPVGARVAAGIDGVGVAYRRERVGEQLGLAGPPSSAARAAPSATGRSPGPGCRPGRTAGPAASPPRPSGSRAAPPKLQRPQVVAAGEPVVGQLDRRPLRQHRRHLLAATERERRGQEQHATHDEQREDVTEHRTHALMVARGAVPGPPGPHPRCRGRAGGPTPAGAGGPRAKLGRCRCAWVAGRSPTTSWP